MAGSPIKQRDMARIDETGEAYIFQRLENGATLTAIARELGVRLAYLSTWCNREERRAEYKQARKLGAASLAADGLEIVDEATPVTAQVAGMRSRYRQWLAERMDPDTYGDKGGAAVQVNVNGLHLEALQKAAPRNVEGERVDAGTVAPSDWLE